MPPHPVIATIRGPVSICLPVGTPVSERDEGLESGPALRGHISSKLWNTVEGSQQQELLGQSVQRDPTWIGCLSKTISNAMKRVKIRHYRTNKCVVRKQNSVNNEKRCPKNLDRTLKIELADDLIQRGAVYTILWFVATLPRESCAGETRRAALIGWCPRHVGADCSAGRYSRRSRLQSPLGERLFQPGS